MDAARLLLPYRLRTVRAGIETSVAALLVLATFALATDGAMHSLRFALVLVGETACLAVIAALPWRRLFLRGQGERLHSCWLAGNVALISLAVAFTGGARSNLYLLYVLTLAYAAAAVRLRTQVALLAATCCGYVAAAAPGGSASVLLLRLALLAILAFLTGFLSRELERRAAEKEHLSLHDPLTGLANRALFHDRVADAVDGAGRAALRLAVLVVDLDGFKEVNDSLGHATGDALLREVARRLDEEVRAQDVVARLGGDEFAVLLPGVEDAADAFAIGRRLAAALSQPFAVDSVTLDLEASIGVAVLPDHGRSGDELLRCADVAMYAAKDVRSGCELYTDRSEESAGLHRLALLGELRRALEARQLVLHYQPKVDVGRGGLCGVEALVRWLHPERGLVPPDEFVPLVEQTGLIGPLTRYVLDEALGQLRAWEDRGLELTVAVNVSARNLHDPGFAAQVGDLLAHHGIAPERLEVELTESALVARPQRALRTLLDLSGLGVRLVLDDFGTGYSSLAQLRRLPVREIKIDKSFVLAMADNGHDEVLVQAMIDLGRNLGLSVVAEGVETAGAWTRLAEMGCDLAQGYYLSRPLPADELEDWLARRAETAA